MIDIKKYEAILKENSTRFFTKDNVLKSYILQLSTIGLAFIFMFSHNEILSIIGLMISGVAAVFLVFSKSFTKHLSKDNNDKDSIFYQAPVIILPLLFGMIIGCLHMLGLLIYLSQTSPDIYINSVEMDGLLIDKSFYTNIYFCVVAFVFSTIMHLKLYVDTSSFIKNNEIENSNENTYKIKKELRNEIKTIKDSDFYTLMANNENAKYLKDEVLKIENEIIEKDGCKSKSEYLIKERTLTNNNFVIEIEQN